MIRRLACAIAVVAVSSVAVGGSSVLLRDINPSAANSYRGSDLFLAGSQGGSRFYFGATMAWPNRSAGQLWSTDGTPAGTRIVGAIAGGAVPTNFVSLGNATVFFLADENGSELWRTDGTVAGTHLVREIYGGYADGVNRSRGMVRFDTRALFVGNEPNLGEELWVTDGTGAGTKLFADLAAGLPSSTPYFLTEMADGSVAFRANGDLYRADAATSSVKQLSENVTIRSITAAAGRIYFEGFTDATGWELWTSDGQSRSGTHIVTDLVPGPGSSFWPTAISVQMAALGTKLVFPAIDGQGGNTAWITDGTEAGTHKLGDGALSESFVSMGDRVFYLSGSRRELWSTDGTSTSRFLPPAPDDPRSVGVMTATAHRLFFTSGGQLWASDGTEAGTVPVTNVEQRSFVPFISDQPTTFDDRVIFGANDLVHGREPWASDGTMAGTAMIANASFDDPGSASATFLGATSRGVFFSANDPFRLSLWLTDGSAAGTKSISNRLPDVSVTVGDTFFFGSDKELWKSDGTAEGTVAIRSFPLNSSGRSILDLTTNALGTFVVVADGSAAGSQLWKTDGTAAGTVQIAADVLRGRTQIDVAGRLFFLAGWPYASIRTSDGTAAGATTLATLPSGGSGRMVAAGGAAMWLWSENSDKTSVWRSDGSVDGTQKVADVAAGTPFFYTEGAPIVSLLDRIIFVLKDAESGGEPWVSDGTSAGTKRLKDIRAGGGSSQPAEFVTIDDRMYFSADDGVHGRELWVTDGTEAGTKIVRDIAVGATGSELRNLTVAGDLLFFTASDGARGSELWQSDGTPEGTQLADDVNPGPASSSPSSLFANGSTLYFSASDPASGDEPRIYSVAVPPLLSVADVRAEETAPVTITVRLASASTNTVTVDWTTVDGTAIAGSDYIAAHDTLTFEPGQTEKQLTVSVVADGAAETNEVFYVRLSNPANAKLSRRLGAVIVEDRDRRVDLQLSIEGRDLVIRNAGPSIATGVKLRRRSLSADLYGWATGCTTGCALGDIQPGGTVTVPIPVRARFATEIIGAEATAAQRDTNATNNLLTVMIQGDDRMAFVNSPAYPVAAMPAQAYVVTSPLGADIRNLLFSSSNALVWTPPASVPYQPTQTSVALPLTPLAAGDTTLTVGAVSERNFKLHVVNSGDTIRWTPAVTLDTKLSGWTFGDEQAFTARIPALAPDSGVAPGGTVSFIDGDALLGVTPLVNGIAVLPYDHLAPATHQLRAVYSGDANFNPSDGTATLYVSHRIPQLAATTHGNSITVTVTGVAATAPGGSVTITENGQVLGSTLMLHADSALQSSVTVQVPVGPGAHSVTLAYSGDANYSERTATVKLGMMKRRSAAR